MSISMLCFTDELEDNYVCTFEAALELRARLRARYTGLSTRWFSTDHSKAVPLLQFFFVRPSLVLQNAFVLSCIPLVFF